MARIYHIAWFPDALYPTNSWQGTRGLRVRAETIGWWSCSNKSNCQALRHLRTHLLVQNRPGRRLRMSLGRH